MSRRRSTKGDYPVDTRVLELAETFIQGPAESILRQGMVQKLAERIQVAIEDWFREMEQP